MRKTATGIVVAMALLSGGIVAERAAQQDVDLQAAIRTETVDGDLRGAIAQYAKLAVSGDRTLAAQALLRMAGVYEKLGDAQARAIYEQLVREYADQKDAVALARERLGRTSPPGRSTSMSSRRMLQLPPQAALVAAAASLDGRFVTYSDWSTGGDLVMYEFATGYHRRLTDRQRPGEVDGAALSRDGKQVAYSWYDYGHNRYELRIASLAGSGVPASRLLFDSEDVGWVEPFDWSPDGTSIAVQLTRADNTGQMGVISTRNGALRVLKSAEWKGSRRLVFSPDGRYLGFDLPAGDTRNDERDVFIIAVDGSHEAKAVAGPSDDTVVGWSPDGASLLFASDRNGSVGLWAIPVAQGKHQGAAALIKPDIARPSIQVTASGSLLYGVLIGERDIRVAGIDLETGKSLSPATKSVPTFVGFNDSPAWSPDGKSLAYLSRRDRLGRGRVLGIQSDETGQVQEWQPKQLNVFQQPRWAPDGRSVLVQGRDLKNRGDAFRIDAQSGETTPLAARAGTRPQLSRDGSKLYSKKNIEGRLVYIAEWDTASGHEPLVGGRSS